jgi:Uma2 family endonuclease
MVIQEKFYTADDLWDLSHLPEYDEIRLELSEGNLIIMAPAGGKHGGLAGEIYVYVHQYVKTNKLGYVTAAETGYILDKNPSGKDTVRAPDVGFVRGERLPEGLPDGFIPFAPDLAVEVASPNESGDDIQDKVLDYLRYGTRAVWYFYPKSRTVNVHTKEGTRTITEDEVLDGGDALPGFSLRVGDVFEG